MRHALFRRASIPGWLALLLAFAERLYNLIDAWSNIEFLREKLQGWRLDSILFYLSATPVQLALVAVGLAWIAVVATRPRAAARAAALQIEPGAEADQPQVERPPHLSDAARDLLREAALDPTGVIMRFGMLAGTSVRTNQRSFVEPGNARSAAQWRGAVDELQNVGLIEDRAGKGEVFYVTAAGYRAADLLRTA